MRPERRYRVRPEVLREVAGATSPAPGAAGGRRLFVRTLTATLRRAGVPALRRAGGDGAAEHRCLGLVRRRRSWRIPRAQPGHGMAVCRRARAASSGSAHCMATLGPDRYRSSVSVRCRRCARLASRRSTYDLRGATSAWRADRLGPVSLALRPSPSRAVRHAGGPARSRHMVTADGVRARCRPDAMAGVDATLHIDRRRRFGFSGAHRHRDALSGHADGHRRDRGMVYQWVGVEILRRAWVNLDFVWTLALVAAGGLLLLA